MAATALRDRPEATITLITPEQEPLWIFGDAAGVALADRGIELCTARVTDDVLWLAPAS
jgi:hypothetical protein